MKISEIFEKKQKTISFEVFPPKTDDKFDSVETAVKELAGMKPDFISVTYGAGGGTSKNTAKIADVIQNTCGITALAHLTCVSATRDEIDTRLNELSALGIENILALRGDIPADSDFPSPGHFHFAGELVGRIAGRGGFCIGGACYPEGHPEAADPETDLKHLAEKAAAGCSFLTTQMFFENHLFYRFLERARAAGITVPILAGIMPVTSAGQIVRMCSLSGASLGSELTRLIARFGEKPAEMRKAGLDYAARQIADLWKNGVSGIHIYTMNRPDTAAALMEATK